MSIDFKHELGQYILFDPRQTNIVYLAIVNRHREEEVGETDYHEDVAKQILASQKPHQTQRLFGSQMYREFCAALQQSIDKKRLIYDRDTDTIATNW